MILRCGKCGAEYRVSGRPEFPDYRQSCDCTYSDGERAFVASPGTPASFVAQDMLDHLAIPFDGPRVDKE